MMHLNVVFSVEAEETFDAIGQQLAARFGARELNIYRARVYEVIDVISKFPFIFKAVGRDDKVRKGFIHRNCSMFYDVGETQIEILFFWDNRQDPIL